MYKLWLLLQFQIVQEEAVDKGGPSREFWRLFVHKVPELHSVCEAGICLFVKNNTYAGCVCVCVLCHAGC